MRNTARTAEPNNAEVEKAIRRLTVLQLLNFAAVLTVMAKAFNWI